MSIGLKFSIPRWFQRFFDVVRLKTWQMIQFDEIDIFEMGDEKPPAIYLIFCCSFPFQRSLNYPYWSHKKPMQICKFVYNSFSKSGKHWVTVILYMLTVVVFFRPGYGLLHHLEASEAAVCEVSLTAFRSLDGFARADASQVDGSDTLRIHVWYTYIHLVFFLWDMSR